MDKEISNHLARILDSHKIDPKDVESVSVVGGGDHGDVAFQFGATVIVKTTWKEKIDFEVSIIELICRKDTADYRGNRPGIYVNSDGKYCGIVGAVPDGTKFQSFKSIERVRLYVTGDLAFYAMALGRESMSGHWCYLCKLSRTQYTSMLHNNGEMWTMATLKEFGTHIKNKRGKADQGVKQPPWWDFIELENFVVPLLHTLIGIGNDLLESFREWVNEEIENWNQQEYRTRKAISTAEHKIIDELAARDEWDASPDGRRLLSLQGMIRNRKKTMLRLGAVLRVADEASNNNSNSPLDVNELLTAFSSFVQEDVVDDDTDGIEGSADTMDDDIGVEEVTNAREDEASTIRIPASLDSVVRSKIEKYREDMEAKQRELEPLAVM